MIVIVSVIAGIVLGAMSARKKNGNRLDMAQYSAVYAIMFGLAGVVLTLIIEKML